MLENTYRTRVQIVDCHFKSRRRPDKMGKSNKNNNQIEHPRK